MTPVLWGAVAGLVGVNAAMAIGAWATWFERRFSARMQNRPGPTEVGPAGLLQPIADLLKMLQKEEILPRHVDRPLFRLAPGLVLALVLVPLAVVPVAPGWIGADLDIGLLFAMSVSSLVVLPVWIAGWASNNKYALLGAMRAAAQAVSFEVPLLLTAVVPIVLAGSGFRLADIVAAQADGHWFALWPPGPGAVAFVIFFIAALAEANRIPFDIPEAESELVAGVMTEYTGIRAGVLQLSEYIHTLVSSLLAAALFLGGWDGPGPDGAHWMLLKTGVLFVGIYWIRWTWLRLRADQFMALCWTWLVPGSLATVVLAALWRRYE